jgi:hypothetical protein
MSLQRVRHGEREELRACDLSAALSYETSLDALHVLAVHATFGIGVGLRVLLSPDRTRLLVCPGLAYDGCCRLLLLPNAIELAAPAVDSDGLVLILTAAPMGDAVCDSAFIEALLKWRPLAEVRLADEVPLALLRATADGVELALTPRRHARPLARPRFAVGTLSFELSAKEQVEAGGAKATIDTSSAAFSGQPVYLVEATASPPRALFVSLNSVSHDNFVLQVAVPTLDPMQASQAAPLTVTGRWLGVEPAGQCEPTPSADAARTETGQPVTDWQSVWQPLLEPPELPE